MVAVARKHLPLQNTEVSEFETDVLEGLRSTPKYLPAKYFYDACGFAPVRAYYRTSRILPDAMRDAHSAPARR